MSHRKPLDVELTDVLYVPDLECNLISVKQLTRNGLGVIFRNEYCSIIECNEVFTVAKCCNGLYKLNIEDHRSRRSYKANLCVHEWHSRLAHRNLADILANKGPRFVCQGLRVFGYLRIMFARKDGKATISQGQCSC